MNVSSADEVVGRHRERIDALDRRILEAVNERIGAVEELHRYKREHGIPRLDPGRERALLDELRAANAGPLSDEGVQELAEFIVALVRKEQARG